MKYAVYGFDESEIQNEPMYWSNEFGWTTLEQADIFDSIDEFYLPLGGKWIEIK